MLSLHIIKSLDYLSDSSKEEELKSILVSSFLAYLVCISLKISV